MTDETNDNTQFNLGEAIRQGFAFTLAAALLPGVLEHLNDRFADAYRVQGFNYRTTAADLTHAVEVTHSEAEIKGRKLVLAIIVSKSLVDDFEGMKPHLITALRAVGLDPVEQSIVKIGGETDDRVTVNFIMP